MINKYNLTIMKKLLLVLIVIILLIGAPILYPRAVGFVQQFTTPKGYLTVKEEKGTDDIYIDGALTGKTPIINKAISSQTHSIKIVRDKVSSLYYTLNTTVFVEPNTNTVITAQLGPSEPYTFYNILTLQKTPSGSGISVDIENASASGTLSLAGQSIKNESFIDESPGTYHLVYKDGTHIGIDDE